MQIMKRKKFFGRRAMAVNESPVGGKKGISRGG
jgi:hypothetical protein